MLTADAFGVLPRSAVFPLIRRCITSCPDTRRGLPAPSAACRAAGDPRPAGSALHARHPTVYAKMLGERIAKTGAKCWLVQYWLVRRCLAPVSWKLRIRVRWCARLMDVLQRWRRASSIRSQHTASLPGCAE